MVAVYVEDTPDYVGKIAIVRVHPWSKLTKMVSQFIAVFLIFFSVVMIKVHTAKDIGLQCHQL